MDNATNGLVKSMKKNISILFVGTFLSQRRGSQAIAEKICSVLKHNFRTLIFSNLENKILRGFDIFLKSIFFRCDIAVIDVYSGNAFYYAWLSSKIFKFRSKKIILVLRGGKLDEFYRNNISVMDKVLKSATIAISPSLFLKRYFSRAGYDIKHMPNPIDLDKFKKIKIKKNRSMLWVRAFGEIYNPELAIKVLYEVRKLYNDIELTMIGPDLGQLEKCKYLIENLKLNSSVKIIGVVDNDDLPRIFNEHLIYINTTEYESFGNAVLESAACGLPVVSTNVGEIPIMWKNNFDILISSSFNPTDFADQVLKLLNDQKLHSKISKNALSKVKKYSQSKIVDSWEKLFSDIYHA